MSDRARQIRLGLANSLNFLAKQALERRAEEERTQLLQRKAQADAVADSDKQRYQAALDLAKLGNIGAQGGLQDYARTGNLGALENIGEFDKTAAQGRMNAKDFLDTLLQREQPDAATQVAQKVPGMENIRLGITPRQQGELDILGARKLKIETDRQIAEARKNAYVGHLEMLTKSAKAKLKQIEKETERAAGKGKVDDDHITATNKALDELESTIAGEIKQRLADPTSYADPDDQTTVLPDVRNKLQELYETYSDIRTKKKRIADYRVQQLPSAISAERRIPMRDYEAPRQTPEQFRQELMQNLLRGVTPSQQQQLPVLNW